MIKVKWFSAAPPHCGGAAPRRNFMQISYLGHSCFKIQNNETTLIVDPYNDNIGLKMPKISADIVLSTHHHPDHNNFEAIRGNPFKINSPGEYEIKDFFIYAIASFHDNEQGKKRGNNLIFLIEVEGIRVAHFGDFGQAAINEEQLKKLEGIDILLIPVGGVYTIDAKSAAAIVAELEPRIVIPMHYQVKGLKYQLDSLDKFKRELGSKIETVDKLKVKRKDLPEEETKVIILTTQN